MRSIFQRAAGFSLVPIISIAASFFILPLIAALGTGGGWAAVLIGQSVGGALALFLIHGWSLNGPTRVAPLGVDDAEELYVASMRQRIALTVFYLPLTLVLCAVLAPAGWQALAMLMGFATLLGGYSPAWYWVGRGQPRNLVMFEAIPRMLGMIASFPLLFLTRELLVYPITLIVAVGAGLVAFHVKARIGVGRLVPRRGSGTIRGIVSGTSAAISVAVAGLYTSLSVALVASVAPLAAQTQFGTGDRFYKLAGQTVAIAGNTFQGWVAEPHDPTARRRRTRYAVMAHGGLALAGAGALWLVGPWFIELFLGAEYAVPADVMLCYGLAFAALTMNSAVGRLILVPRGMNHAVLVSTIVGAVVGVPAILTGAAVRGR